MRISHTSIVESIQSQLMNIGESGPMSLYLVKKRALAVEALQNMGCQYIARLRWSDALLYCLCWRVSRLETQHGTSPNTFQRGDAVATTHPRSATLRTEHCGVLPTPQTRLQQFLRLAAETQPADAPIATQRFVPVTITASTPIAEVGLPNGIVVKLPIDADPAQITRFITAVTPC